MERIFPGTHEPRMLLLMCHQGHLLIVSRLVRNQTLAASQQTDIEDYQIGLFALAMTIPSLGFQTTLAQARVFLYGLFRRMKKRRSRT